MSRMDGQDHVQDRRVARTKRAVVHAFVELIGQHRYDEISPAMIIARADVGKSTFYAHFRSKDDVLHESMGWLLALLAEAVEPGDDFAARLRHLLGHFWENRRLARTVLAEPIVGRVRRSLAERIEARLSGEDRPLRAVQIAAAQLALLDSWTRGETVATVDQLVVRIGAVAAL